jgi:F-type H+-transporting ATPase subunit a
MRRSKVAEGFHVDPVSQFAIKPLIDFSIGGVNLSYTNSSLYMTISVLVLLAFFGLASKGRQLVPSRLQMAAELAYSKMLGLVQENVGPDALRYFPLIFSVFFMVLVGNLLGMIPGAFTYTSHIAVTLMMAMSLFILITIMGIAKHGLHFFSKFMPPGVPMLMAPLIVVLELISYLVRPFTLAVRLFANMMAGHMVLKLFAYFTLGLITSGSAGLMALGLLPLIMNTALIALEFFVAGLQAFIFTILTCVYLRDALVIEH